MRPDRPLLSLAGRRYLVVGGGQGMGEATCLLLAECGADVAVMDRDIDLAETVTRQIEAMGRGGIAVGDVPLCGGFSQHRAGQLL
ncbi:SDR family NAD(P)-dependent oxidoreductase [Microbacterium aurantiacum]|uniref:SDR family NAD(P)-dependent oxidoreductase n=2 Tax=Microbacterium aurantiacum TaxID=162393 RepID=A0ABT8FVV0_9MICO|nr:SDR family NAD(P)-dependent oxidoreductase [Microbacterium aurantiacum]MDN4465350.1 SDR family NAD(P)-dependent oxidoreductase [Microbacterium aurantiacum]